MNAMRTAAPLQHANRLFVGGAWAAPSSTTTIEVVDPTTEEHYFAVPDGDADDMARAVGAARTAFDEGPWPRLRTPSAPSTSRAAAGIRARADDLAVITASSRGSCTRRRRARRPDRAHLRVYVAMADTFPFVDA